MYSRTQTHGLFSQLHTVLVTCGMYHVYLYNILMLTCSVFQVIANSVRKSHVDAHRFEKISNIVKQFKLSCR